MEPALAILLCMEQEGVAPSLHMYRHLLKACTKRKSLAQAKRVYDHLMKHRLESIKTLGELIISALVKCGGLEDAVQLFESLPDRTVASWRAVMFGYTALGQYQEALNLYCCMQEEGTEPDRHTLLALLSACKQLADVEKGKLIHAEAVKYGFACDLYVGTSLVDMYGKCHSILDAQSVFDGLHQRSVVTWNVMLAAYVAQDQAENAWQLYERMWQEGESPDARTFVSTLQACAAFADKEDDVIVDGRSIKRKSLEMGKVVHAAIHSKGLASNVFTGNTLVCMYGRCGSIVDAQNVFDRLSDRTVVSWTVMITAYAQDSQSEKALQLYQQMEEEGISPDTHALVSALQACGMLAEKEEATDELCMKIKSLEIAKAIHARAQKLGWASDVFVGSTLVSSYGKCGSMTDARCVFDCLPKRNVVAWTAMVVTYVQLEHTEKAFQLYHQMGDDGVSPDDVALVSILQACSKTGGLHLCRQIHHSVLLSRKEVSAFLAAALIHAYGCCGSMVDAQNVFDVLGLPNLVVWNTLIAGYARKGNISEALRCFEGMQLMDVHPDGVTFLAILSACSHTGLVETGLHFFELMCKDYGITPDVQHFGIVMDLYGRAGQFTKIQTLLSALPMKPDLTFWSCLLGACQKHGQVLLGELAFQCAVQLNFSHAATYVLMSNIYANAGLHCYAKKVKTLRQAEGAQKEHGQSWIEHGLTVQAFAVGDPINLQKARLHIILEKVRFGLDEEG